MPPEPHRQESQSAAPCFSPGLVQSNEIVLRTVLDPDHLKDGKLTVAAISLDDIRFRGWSVDRKSLTSQWRIRLAHWRWKRKRPRILKSYVLPMAVRDVREANPTTGQQDFVVTDTAVWLNPAHASVLLSHPCGEGAARGFRTSLLRKLPPYVEVSSAFTPTDKRGYSRGMFKQLAAILLFPLRWSFRVRRSKG